MQETNNKSIIHPERYLNENIISFKEFGHHQSQNRHKRLNSRTLNILVAEDSRTEQLLISTILKNAGHTIALVENGNQALDLLEKNDFDLIILSSEMPVLNGLDTTKLHRSISLDKPKTPVIILGAHATQHSIDSYLEAGANVYLTKPIDATKLLNSIDVLISQTNKAAGCIIKFPANVRHKN